MSALSDQEKASLISRCHRLNNYCLLKLGLFAIGSVYGLADFVNANTILRWLYVLIWLLFGFYVYFYIDTKKFVQKIKSLIKSS